MLADWFRRLLDGEAKLQAAVVKAQAHDLSEGFSIFSVALVIPHGSGN